MNNCDNKIRPLLESAVNTSISIQPDRGDCKIVLPLERSDGDAVTIWVIKQGEKYRITDEGETYGLLYLSNINLDQERRENRVNTIQERFRLDEAKEQVSALASEENLGQRILDVAQAIQSLSYLTYTRRQYTQTDFRADVGTFLTEMNFRYNSNPDVEGISETHRVDFSILGQERPTYVETLHAEDASTAKTMAQRTAYKWGDIGQKMPDVHRVSVVDDESGEFGRDAERILTNWSDEFVPWSMKDRLSAAITA